MLDLAALCVTFSILSAILFTIINILRQVRIQNSLSRDAIMFIFYIWVIISQENLFYPLFIRYLLLWTICYLQGLAYTLANIDPHLGFPSYLPMTSLRSLKKKSTKAFPWSTTLYSYNSTISCKSFVVLSNVQLCPKWLQWTFQKNMSQNWDNTVIHFFQYAMDFLYNPAPTVDLGTE